jgi:hypothetical protein
LPKATEGEVNVRLFHLGHTLEVRELCDSAASNLLTPTSSIEVQNFLNEGGLLF